MNKETLISERGKELTVYHQWTPMGHHQGTGSRQWKQDGCVWTILHAVLLWLWFWFAIVCLFASLSPGWSEIYFIAKDDLHPQLSLPFSTYAVSLCISQFWIYRSNQLEIEEFRKELSILNICGLCFWLDLTVSLGWPWTPGHAALASLMLGLLTCTSMHI